MVRKWWDLSLLGVLAALAVILAFTDTRQLPVLAPFGIVLALFLPGVALSNGLLPDLGGAERLLTGLGLSCVVDVLGGLALQLTPWGLQPGSWAVWLGGVTFLGLGVAWLRRSALPGDAVPRLRFGATLAEVLILGLALAIVAIALGTARYAASARDLPFTQLWALPVTSAGAYGVQIGVHNQEGRPQRYHVYVDEGDELLAEWPEVEIAADATWSQRLDLSELPMRPVQVSLFRLDQPAEAYRWVRLAPESFEYLSSPSPGLP